MNDSSSIIIVELQMVRHIILKFSYKEKET